MSDGEPFSFENVVKLLAGHSKRAPPEQKDVLSHGWHCMPS
jgi:hypothetical protein